MSLICVIERCGKPVIARGWCTRHWTRWSRHGDPLAGGKDRLRGGFWDKVRKTDGCWLWVGALNHGGYGRWRNKQVHRVSWEEVNGPITDGLQLDHLCRVTACVRPDHLEPVTGRDNVHRSPIHFAAKNAAKTHCKSGHPFDEANTYHERGKRRCRACRRLANRRSRAA